MPRERLDRGHARSGQDAASARRRAVASRGRLIVGINPRRPFDDGYRSFLDLVADQLAIALTNARAYEARASARRGAGRARSRQDRHSSAMSVTSFGTPLTLLVGPLEDELSGRRPRPEDRIASASRRRTAMRCGCCVWSTRCSTFRASKRGASTRATSQPTFRPRSPPIWLACSGRRSKRPASSWSSIAPPLPEPVACRSRHVGEDRPQPALQRLQVHASRVRFASSCERTTATSSCASRIPVSVFPRPDLERVFERFHRVRHARARTHEGTGIGLALVQELARLHGGSVDVDEHGRPRDHIHRHASARARSTFPRTASPPREQLVPTRHWRDPLRGGSAALAAGHRTRPGAPSHFRTSARQQRLASPGACWSPTTTRTCATISRASSGSTTASKSWPTAPPALDRVPGRSAGSSPQRRDDADAGWFRAGGGRARR